MEVEILGSELRASRLQKELTLEEVEQELRIRAKFLRAIEAGDYSLLPSQVQARGFLRNYAIFLGQDAGTILARYEQAMGQLDRQGSNGHLPQPAPVVIAKPAETNYPGDDEQTHAAEGVYHNATKPKRRSPVFSSSVFVVGVVAVIVIAAMALGGVRFVEALIAADRNIEGDGVESFIDSVLGGQPTVTPSATFVAVPTATPGGIEISAARMSDSVIVVFDVTRRTWVRVTVDGVVHFEGIVKPGERYQYQGSESINVRAGNGAGLDANVNGEAVGLLGGRGELIDVTLTRAGVETAATTP